MNDESSDEYDEWLFTEAELEQSPSRKDGMTEEEERHCRFTTCNYVEEVMNKLNIPRLTMATAQVFFHRFFIRQSFKAHDRYLVASACIFLASKVEETPRRLNHVVGSYYKLRKGEEKKPEDEDFLKTKAKIVCIERILLHTIAFELRITHPYPFLSKWVAAISKLLPPAATQEAAEVRRKRITQFAWNFVNDSLRTTTCLQYIPEDIAAAAVYLSCVYSQCLPESSSSDDKDGDAWWKVFEIPEKELDAICKENMQPYFANKKGLADTRLLELLDIYPTSHRKRRCKTESS